MKTVLIIDDSNIRLKLRDEFCKLGLNVITAIDTQEARISFFEEEVDLVIINDSIKNFNLLNFLEDVKKFIENIPVILYLGDSCNNSIRNLSSYANIRELSIISKSSSTFGIKDRVKEMLNV
jgi:DNA-binding NtrC family response regulator